MPRINIYVSDPLYERIQRTKDTLKDAWNASEICAVALEQAIESETERDPVLARIKERLGNARGVWTERGQQDARAWAAERATYDELRLVALERTVDEVFAWETTDDIYEHNYQADEDVIVTPRQGAPLPSSFSLKAAIATWETNDQDGPRPELRTYIAGFIAEVETLFKRLRF
jgi:hypothetical protein